MTPLAQALKRSGKSDAALAAHLGVPRQYVGRWKRGKSESGGSDFPREYAPAAAAFLGVAPEYLVLGIQAEEPAGYRVEPNAVFEGSGVRLPAVGQMLRDIQELGATVGGFGDDDSAFEMNGQVVDLVPRPPGLVHRKEVFALRVSNNSMWPKFKDGERVYVERRKPAIGDDVVIELHPAEDGQPGKSFIKNLVSRSSNLIVVEQYNPFGRLEFDTREVRQTFRVIPWQEVAGLA